MCITAFPPTSPGTSIEYKYIFILGKQSVIPHTSLFDSVNDFVSHSNGYRRLVITVTTVSKLASKMEKRKRH